MLYIARKRFVSSRRDNRRLSTEAVDLERQRCRLERTGGLRASLTIALPTVSRVVPPTRSRSSLHHGKDIATISSSPLQLTHVDVGQLYVMFCTKLKTTSFDPTRNALDCVMVLRSSSRTKSIVSRRPSKRVSGAHWVILSGLTHTTMVRCSSTSAHPQTMRSVS